MDSPQHWAGAWSLEPGVRYLNHGSFGPSPRCVQAERLEWIRRLESQPMDFLMRRLEPALAAVRLKLAAWVGAAADDLILVDNATVGMNIVAASVPLRPGDEVLANDHEYGAVLRIWERACNRAGAKLVVQPLPFPLTDAASVVDCLAAAMTPQTRVLVLSHVTSPTALILPVQTLCALARARGIVSCIDGPHAVAMLDLSLQSLACDYYTASCHKWLCAPFGSGFLYVRTDRQAEIQPVLTSWGRTPPGEQPSWRDEFQWLGTRDLSAWLAIPAAIDFLEDAGLTEFRRHGHELAQFARRQIQDLTGLPQLAPDDAAWYGSMVTLPLPPGDAPALQRALWEQAAIEIPVIDWRDQRWVRPSCHLYTTQADIEHLVTALGQLL